ncbi:89_t:CDS:1, partial [Ambispora leptoticha]
LKPCWFRFILLKAAFATTTRLCEHQYLDPSTTSSIPNQTITNTNLPNDTCFALTQLTNISQWGQLASPKKLHWHPNKSDNHKPPQSLIP